MTEYDEYEGGTINKACPHCGQFCKEPDYYMPKFEPELRHGYLMDNFVGCYGESYCKRCKKTVQLSVEFL